MFEKTEVDVVGGVMFRVNCGRGSGRGWVSGRVW